MTSIRSFFGTARAWFGLVVLGTLLGGAISLGVGLMSPPTYLGRVTVLVSPPTGTNPITLSDVEVTQALAPTFAELTTTAPLLQRVIVATKVDTDVETLAKVVSTHVPVGTSLIEIGVSDHDPATAAALANAIANQLMAFRSDASSPVTSKVVLSIVDPAVAPRTPEGLGPMLRAVLGALIGLFLSISLGFLIENVGRGAQRIGQELDTGARPSTTRSQIQPIPDPSALPPSLARTATMRIDPPTARPVATPLPPLQPTAPRLQPAAIRTSTYPPSGWAAPSDTRPAATGDPRLATSTWPTAPAAIPPREVPAARPQPFAPAAAPMPPRPTSSSMPPQSPILRSAPATSQAAPLGHATADSATAGSAAVAPGPTVGPRPAPTAVRAVTATRPADASRPTPNPVPTDRRAATVSPSRSGTAKVKSATAPAAASSSAKSPAAAPRAANAGAAGANGKDARGAAAAPKSRRSRRAPVDQSVTTETSDSSPGQANT